MPVRAGLRAQVGIEHELRPDRTMKRARACWYVGRTTVMVQVLASVLSMSLVFCQLFIQVRPSVCLHPSAPAGASTFSEHSAVERCPEQYLTNG